MAKSGLALALLFVAGCGGGGGDPASAADARACLAKEKLRVLAAPRSPADSDAPDTELIVSSRKSGAFLGFYENEQRAQDAAPQIPKDSKAFRGQVERHGKLTIFWVRGRQSAEADRIKACVL